jgi:hypothetical protein
LLSLSFEDAADGSARLKPRPDTNPSGFHVSMGLSVMTESSPYMRDDDVFLQEHLAHPVNTYE